MTGEYAYYAQFCDEHFADTSRVFGEILTADEALIARAEVGFYWMFGYLPPWAEILELIERVGENYVFVHRDPDARAGM